MFKQRWRWSSDRTRRLHARDCTQARSIGFLHRYLVPRKNWVHLVRGYISCQRMASSCTASPDAPLSASNKLIRETKPPQGSTLSASSLLQQRSRAISQQGASRPCTQPLHANYGITQVGEGYFYYKPWNISGPLWVGFDLQVLYDGDCWKCTDRPWKTKQYVEALNARLVEEAALVGNPRTVIALMKMDQMQKEYGKLLSQLLTAAGIDPSRARVLEAWRDINSSQSKSTLNLTNSSSSFVTL